VAFSAPNRRKFRQGEYDAVSRNSRRATAIAVAGVFAVAPLVSACAAGQHPQSALPTQLAEGVNASAHQVDIRNTFILGPESGQRLAAGSSAPVYAWFVNNGPADRLVAAEAPGVARSVQIAGGAFDLPTGKLVNTVESAGAVQSPTPAVTPTPSPTAKPGQPKTRRTPGAKTSTTPGPTTSTTPGAPATSTPAPPPAPSSKVILTGLAKTYAGGETVRLTLHFQQAGTVTLNVPIVPRNGSYATFAPAPAPAPVPAPSATPLPTATSTPPKATGKKKSRAGKAKKAAATPTA
jgi:copper(I)-binding protein